ncbi:hypothetical protein FA95DRAFT_1570677 [Auriscalpium vulgare]|uniref:Uncharacterized protein n=1 Tax=Auriscalpium vulgare TaxID=40419 RepID=A0ACB8S2N5_9AGAM|nr:hypothetical protein FA95DRAFT_1570677 [Auriscalpium vulgare]
MSLPCAGALLTGNAKFRTVSILLICTVFLAFFLFIHEHPRAFIVSTAPLTTPELAESDFPDARVLLVAAFFPLPKSKHPMTDYEAWFRDFLEPITTDIYFFCPPDVAPLIRSLRGGNPLTLNTSFSSPFDIPPLHGLEERYAQMHAWDREKDMHAPELYAVWNGKPYFLAEGLKNAAAAGRSYDYAFWQDAGGLRDPTSAYRHWPAGRRVEHIFAEAEALTGTAKENIIFFPLWNGPPDWAARWTEDKGPIDETVSEGSFFGGKWPAIMRFHDLYYHYHDLYLARDIFVGKDQTLINTLFYLFPAHFVGVRLYDRAAPATKGVPEDASTPIGECGSTWWYYQWYFASAQERWGMANVWLQDASRTGRDAAWMAAARCRVTRLLPWKWLLRNEYGHRYQLPQASVRW